MDKTEKPGASTRFAAPLTKVFSQAPGNQIFEEQKTFGKFGSGHFK